MFGYSNTTSNAYQNWATSTSTWIPHNWNTTTAGTSTWIPHNWNTTTATSSTFTFTYNPPDWTTIGPDRWSNTEPKVDPDESEWVSDELDDFIAEFCPKEGDSE